MTKPTIEEKLTEALGLPTDEEIPTTTQELLVDIPLDQTLDVKEKEDAPTEVAPVATQPDTSGDSMEDYYDARANIKQLIDNGNRLLNRIMFVVNGSDSARDFEVATQAIKAVSDMNRDLVKMHKTMQDMAKKGVPIEQKPKEGTTNNIFMTTDDMLSKIISEMDIEQNNE